MANVNGFCLQCGRPSRTHCPTCGSLRCYALASRSDRVTRPDGSTAVLKVWRCTRCANLFNDDDWQLRCNAPAEASKSRSKKSIGENPIRFNSIDEVPQHLRDAMDALRKKGY